jgi:hypothetical protein
MIANYAFIVADRTRGKACTVRAHRCAPSSDRLQAASTRRQTPGADGRGHAG